MKLGSIRLTQKTKFNQRVWHPKGTIGPANFKTERSIKKGYGHNSLDSGVIQIVSKGQKTDTSSYYEDVLRKVKTALAKKSRGKLHRQILFHDDNAPVHSAKLARALLTEL